MQEKKQRAKKKEKTKKGKSTSSAAAKQVWAMLELSDKIEEKINEQNGDSSKGKT